MPQILLYFIRNGTDSTVHTLDSTDSAVHTLEMSQILLQIRFNRFFCAYIRYVTDSTAKYIRCHRICHTCIRDTTDSGVYTLEMSQILPQIH